MWIPVLWIRDNYDYKLQDTSVCIDAGDPGTMFHDVEDPKNPGFALLPSKGTLRNDIGAFGGPYVYRPLTVGINRTNRFYPVLKLYPNPASRFVRLESPSHNPVKLLIFNPLGRTIYQSEWRIGTGEKELNVSAWPNGIYFVEVKTEKGQTTRKLIICH